MKDKIGFIGLGAMGNKMVPLLLKTGYEVFVSDLNTDAVAQMVMLGAAYCESPSHVADNADIVLVCLPTPDIVERVALGDDGVVQGKRVRVFVDHSTSGTTVARHVAAELAKRGIEALDAPLAGGVAGATSGTLSVMVGGNREAFDRCEPVFRSFGKNVVHVGSKPGMGQALKLVNNMIVASTLVATSEAVLMGVKAGLPADIMLQMLNVSTARSFTSEVLIGKCVMSRRFDMGFRMDLMRKDIRLFLAEAEAHGTPAATSSVVKQFFDQALATADDPARDMTFVVAYLEKMAQAQISS